MPGQGGSFLVIQLGKISALLQESPERRKTVAQQAKTITLSQIKGLFLYQHGQMRLIKSKLRLRVSFWLHISNFFLLYVHLSLDALSQSVKVYLDTCIYLY